MRKMKALKTLLKIKNLNIIEKAACSYYLDKDGKINKKHLKAFLNEDSPLKDNIEGIEEWITTPYPVGTILPENQRSVPKIDPESTSVILFPGQGNQYVGMGKELLKYSVVKEMFDAASSILGYNLLKLCLEGPKEKLDQTQYCQPAILVCSLAAIEKLKIEHPTAITHCIATCGFSLGEISALIFAGCFSFDKGVHLTKIRAEAMQICSDAVRSGMLTILYGPDSNISNAIQDAVEECKNAGLENPVCIIANYLIPECKVLAGHELALEYIKNNLEKYKIRKASMLPVSGAFHTKLMQEASFPLKAALKKFKINEPIVPVLSNEYGRPYKNADEIARKLPYQLCKPVKWEQIMHYIYERPNGTKFPHTYECGPGKSLSVILKRLNGKAAKNCHNIFC